MLFRVQNLGPLREAEVDLSKDIIVLAGPNNSGKTYLAWSVYGLHRMRTTPEVDLSRWVKQLIESPDHSIAIGEFLDAEGDKLIKGFINEYQKRLHLCFSAEESRFVQTTIEIIPASRDEIFDLEGESIYISTPPHLCTFDAEGGRIHWNLVLNRDELVDSAVEVPLHHSWHDPGVLKATSEAVNSLSAEGREEVESGTNLALLSHFGLPYLRPCTLFPAERIAVNIFAKELALERTKLVDEMVDADLEGRTNVPLELVRRKAGRYPWPIRDSLRTANDLARLKKRKSKFADLADELESAVLRGSVSVADTGELRFAPNDNKDAHLEMHLTASVVKSLSSVVFYFRHLARPNDFIIIDEPELNLHPDNQRLITRILAKAARRGIKIMMSTHSDYVLRELNHLIMLSKLPENDAKDMGYDPLWAIDPQRIGVYLFNENTAKPVPIEDTGFSIKTIDDVVDKLNADEQRLYAKLLG